MEARDEKVLEDLQASLQQEESTDFDHTTFFLDQLPADASVLDERTLEDEVTPLFSCGTLLRPGNVPPQSR